MKPPQTLGQAEDAVLQLECDMVQILSQEAGVHEREAAELAKKLVDGLRRLYGGVRLGHRGLYIPAPSKAERDEQIRQAFNGRNHAELQRRFDIKRSRLYQILRHTDR